MGFKSNSYCKVWEIEPKSDTYTRVRLSISKKNKETGAYDTEFSGTVMFVGTLCAKKAAALAQGARIKLVDVDVTNTYNKEEGKAYTNFKCFSFEDADAPAAQVKRDVTDPQPVVDDGEVNESRLPF